MKLDSPAHRKSIRLQKKLFHTLRQEVDRLFGKMPESIRTYDQENRHDFRLKPGAGKSISKTQLIDAVCAADVTFIADFHTFDQAQRTALRIMREAVERTNCHWAVGLELIPSHYQERLDDFQKGKLTTRAFLEAIHYTEDWGFPWSNYAPIFNWARKKGIPLIALDRPKELYKTNESSDLMERDRWAAGRIIQTFQESVKPMKMLVLFGELHVGSKHLPLQLKQVSRSVGKRHLKSKLRSVSIHQNEDKLYWKLAMENREFNTQILQLKRNIFCVFSSTPWAKLQSLVNWAEGGDLSIEPHHQAQSDQPELTDLEDENPVDFLSLIRIYGNTLSEFLTVPAPQGPHGYEALNVVGIHHADSIHSLGRKEGFGPDEIRMIRFHLAYHFRMLIPKLGIAYLATPSHNGAAEIAAIHLLSATRKNHYPLSFRRPDDFYRVLLESAFGFFGSLILNPRRKCDLPTDHDQRIKSLKDGGVPHLPFELEARVLTLEILKTAARNVGRLNPGLEERIQDKRQWPVLLLSCRFVGRILGKMLHLEILTGKAEIATVRRVFLNTPRSSMSTENLSFQSGFELLLENLSPVDLGPSKQDHL